MKLFRRTGEKKDLQRCKECRLGVGGRRTATAYVNIFLPNISLGFLNLLITLLDKILVRMRGMQALRACAESIKEMKGMRRDSRVQEGTSHNFK